MMTMMLMLQRLRLTWYRWCLRMYRSHFGEPHLASLTHLASIVRRYQLPSSQQWPTREERKRFNGMEWDTMNTIS